MVRFEKFKNWNAAENVVCRDIVPMGGTAGQLGPNGDCPEIGTVNMFGILLWLVWEVCLQPSTFEMPPWSGASLPCREGPLLVFLRPDTLQLVCLFIFTNGKKFLNSQCEVYS